MPFPEPHEHYENNARGHTWKTRSDGITVHDFAYDDGNHNGPGWRSWVSVTSELMNCSSLIIWVLISFRFMD